MDTVKQQSEWQIAFVFSVIKMQILITHFSWAIVEVVCVVTTSVLWWSERKKFLSIKYNSFFYCLERRHNWLVMSPSSRCTSERSDYIADSLACAMGAHSVKSIPSVCVWHRDLDLGFVFYYKDKRRQATLSETATKCTILSIFFSDFALQVVVS